MAQLDLASFRAAYGAFLGPERVLLTGHSHQAWPDVARAAQAAYFDDSARFVDEKWGKAVLPRMARVGQKILARMGFEPGDPIAFGKSTHELVFRLLTCLRWSERPRVVTTTSEFHSLHRQLARLSEEGVEVVWVDASDRRSLPERLYEACDERTAMVAVSGVLFEDSYVVPGLGRALGRVADRGGIALVDAYHAFNVVPLDLGPGKERFFVTAGGYKYAQFGEGLCWMRAPRGCSLRPVYTGWFADFDALERPRSMGPVGYGEGGERFLGATFDGSALYRAEAVLEHFERFGLDVPALRAISLRQTERILARLDAHGLPGRKLEVLSSREQSLRGGFVAVRVEDAARVVERLRARQVHVDARGDIVRLGPAPYVTDDEIDRGVEALAAVVLAGLAPRASFVTAAPPASGTADPRGSAGPRRRGTSRSGWPSPEGAAGPSGRSGPSVEERAAVARAAGSRPGEGAAGSHPGSRAEAAAGSPGSGSGAAGRARCRPRRQER